MKRNHVGITSICAACAALLFAGVVPARAQEIVARQTTYFTFSHAVELPGGVTLQPGRYTFKTADDNANDVVQVFNHNGTRILAQFLTVDAKRLDPTQKSLITFRETPAKEPTPIHYWYYPGRVNGHEFVYSMQRPQRIARVSDTPVLARTASAGEAPIAVVEPDGSHVSLTAARTLTHQAVRSVVARAELSPDTPAGAPDGVSTVPDGSRS